MAVNQNNLDNMIQSHEKYNRKSPHMPVSKTKGTSFFPKIQRAECPSLPKPDAKQFGKRNYHESIFKIKGDIPARIKLPTHLPDVDDEKVMQSQHYKDLEAQIESLEQASRQQIAAIEAKKQEINDRLLAGKHDSYQQKYSLWELRNEIMQLENALKEEEQEQERLLYQLGYDGQAEYPDGQFSEGEYQEGSQGHEAESNSDAGQYE